MEFIMAIAMLCQATPAIGDKYIHFSPKEVQGIQTSCQQSYIHCVNVSKVEGTKQEQLERCVLERK